MDQGCMVESYGNEYFPNTSFIDKNLSTFVVGR